MPMSTQIRDPQPSESRLPVRDQHRLAERAFRQGDAPAVRRFTQAFGARTGIEAGPLTDFVLAVSEAAACATAPGPGTAKVRLWLDGSRAYCEVRGNATVRQRAALGRAGGPRLGEEETLRRWVLRQLSDHVSVANGPDGVRVVLSMTVSTENQTRG